MAIARSTQRAHGLYMDIVGSSLRSNTDQRAMYNELNDVVCGTQEYARAKAENTVLCRPSGDGMALVFLDHLEAPLRCALELAYELKRPGSVTVRMGIHSGEIDRVTDINGIEDVIGEGIVGVRRVMDCGESGHILVSGAAAETLEQAAEWHEWFHFLGPCSVKHGKRIAIWNVYKGDLGNPRMPAIMVDQIAEEAFERSRRRPLRLSNPTVIATIVFAAAILSLSVLQNLFPNAGIFTPVLIPLIVCLIIYLVLSSFRSDRPRHRKRSGRDH